MSIYGKTVLVTGANRGIGQALVTEALARGVQRVYAGTRRSLVHSDQRVTPLRLDVTSDAQIRAAAEEIGSLDILVNNAATNPYYGPIIEIDRPRAEKTVAVNQLGYLEWARAAWEAGMSEHGGTILNMASVGGLTVESGIGWYNVTKAAVIHLTEQLAGELGPKVRVNAIAPGLVTTDFARALWEPAGEAIARRLPLRRLGQPEDVARCALFLCSDAASWITGETVVVDGGSRCVPSGGVTR